VDDAMTDGAHPPAAEEADSEIEDGGRRRYVIELVRIPALFDQLLAVRILDDEVRCNAQFLDLPAKQDRIVVIVLEQRELDARGTGVDDCERLHWRSPIIEPRPWHLRASKPQGGVQRRRMQAVPEGRRLGW
jgi:hypothetical protein